MIFFLFLLLPHCAFEIFAARKHVNDKGKYRLGIAENLCFHRLEKAIKLTKNKITSLEENFKKNWKTFSKVKCLQISYKNVLA